MGRQRRRKEGRWRRPSEGFWGQDRRTALHHAAASAGIDAAGVVRALVAARADVSAEAGIALVRRWTGGVKRAAGPMLGKTRQPERDIAEDRRRPADRDG